MAGTTYSYFVGPLVGLLIIGVFVLLLRWAFGGRPQSLVQRPARSGAETEYGMLVPVSRPESDAEGQQIRGHLERLGIRATLVMTRDGRRVLVFEGDEERAREALR
jgi:hypothetical protein